MSAPFVPSPRQNIPILGLPFEMGGWFFTIALRCNCEAKAAVLVVGQVGAAGQCPACQRVAVFQGVQVDPATGQLNFQIGLAVRSES